MPARRTTVDFLAAGGEIGYCLLDERLVDHAKALAHHQPLLAWRGGGLLGDPSGEDPCGIARDMRLERQLTRALVLRAQLSRSRPVSQAPETVRTWLQPSGPANGS